MKEKISLNANYLKLIAIIAMTIDHATDLIAPNFSNEPYAIALHGIVSWFFVSKTYALVLLGVLLIYPVLKLYNGEKGK